MLQPMPQSTPTLIDSKPADARPAAPVVVAIAVSPLRPVRKGCPGRSRDPQTLLAYCAIAPNRVLCMALAAASSGAVVVSMRCCWGLLCEWCCYAVMLCSAPVVFQSLTSPFSVSMSISSRLSSSPQVAWPRRL